MQTSEQRKSWLQLNRAKMNEYQKRYREKPEYKQAELNRHLLRKYNMTIEGKQKLWDDQNGLCAVCHQILPNIFNRDCQIEHNHETNKVRGLAHWYCNIMVGVMENHLILLTDIVEYLKKVM
jgi:hypothetical protein